MAHVRPTHSAERSPWGGNYDRPRFRGEWLARPLRVPRLLIRQSAGPSLRSPRPILGAWYRRPAPFHKEPPFTKNWGTFGCPFLLCRLEATGTTYIRRIGLYRQALF